MPEPKRSSFTYRTFSLPLALFQFKRSIIRMLLEQIRKLHIERAHICINRFYVFVCSTLNCTTINGHKYDLYSVHDLKRISSYHHVLDHLIVFFFHSFSLVPTLFLCVGACEEEEKKMCFFFFLFVCRNRA